MIIKRKSQRKPENPSARCVTSAAYPVLVCPVRRVPLSRPRGGSRYPYPIRVNTLSCPEEQPCLRTRLGYPTPPAYRPGWDTPWKNFEPKTGISYEKDMWPYPWPGTAVPPPRKDMGPDLEPENGTLPLWTDTSLWKHYLPYPSDAGDNKTKSGTGFWFV